MRNYIKQAMVALGATVTLAMIVSTASANNLSVTSRALRIVWASLEFSGGVTVRCRVTIEGSLHENALAKVSGGLIGYITAATVGHPCTGGSVWAYNGTERNEVLGSAILPSSFPWHLTYETFDGTLPSPAAVRILLALARFLARASFFGIPILCALRTGGGNGNATTTAVVAATRVTSVRASGRIRSETGGCPELSITNAFGDGIATQLGNSNSISITLI